MLDLDRLGVSYGPVAALSDVSVSISRGEIVCIVGPNGAGKSTLVNAISGLVPVRTGDIRFEGRSLVGLAAYEIARKGVIQCPEGRQLFGRLTVEENLRVGATRNAGAERIAEDLAFARDLFPVLEALWWRHAETLSGGEQQMVALARSVLAAPRVLMLDEPSLGLAPAVSRDLFAKLPRIAERGAAVLLIEQNTEVALSVASRGYVLLQGRVCVNGPVREIRDFLVNFDLGSGTIHEMQP